MVQIGKKGRVLSEDLRTLFVLVQDDRENSGGYLILKSHKSDFSDGYDDWVEEAKLDAYFSEAGWKIEWTEL